MEISNLTKEDTKKNSLVLLIISIGLIILILISIWWLS